MKIGVISDTHGYLDPRIPALFEGVEHILHAGDIGPQSIILELERIAPVSAVLGNTDTFIPYRETEIIDLGSLKFLVHHIVDLSNPPTTLFARIEKERPDVVVFGHTHKPFAEYRGSRLFFNPGYAGKKRFDLPRTAAVLEISAKGISYRWVRL